MPSLLAVLCRLWTVFTWNRISCCVFFLGNCAFSTQSPVPFCCGGSWAWVADYRWRFKFDERTQGGQNIWLCLFTWSSCETGFNCRFEDLIEPTSHLQTVEPIARVFWAFMQVIHVLVYYGVSLGICWPVYALCIFWTFSNRLECAFD